MATSVTELLGIYSKLNKSNRFDVLVYARMKLAFQFSIPHVRERRRHPRVKVMRVHWV